MPIFEYRCEDCGTTFEKLVRGNGSAAAVACPSCGESRVKTELSTFSAHASGGAKRSSDLPPCAGGMCRTPDLCGRN